MDVGKVQDPAASTGFVAPKVLQMLGGKSYKASSASWSFRRRSGSRSIFQSVAFDEAMVSALGVRRRLAHPDFVERSLKFCSDIALDVLLTFKILF